MNFWWLILTLTVASARSLNPLLTTISENFPAYYSLLNSTGGALLQPGPDLEERFNSLVDGRNFTAFAPSDAAIERLSPEFLTALTSLPLYPLLLSLVQDQIAEGLFDSTALRPGLTIEAIEGFELSITRSTDDPTNLIIANQATFDPSTAINASNGIVYPISSMLNPYAAYFGTSVPDTSLTCEDDERTMGGILKAPDAPFTILVQVLESITPGFIRTALSTFSDSPEIATRKVYFAPTNTAFESLPVGIVESFVQPSNVDLASLLLTSGFAEKTNQNGWVSYFYGLNFTVEKNEGDSSWSSINNAGVQRCICGTNGCVVGIDRMIDPLHSYMK